MCTLQILYKGKYYIFEYTFSCNWVNSVNTSSTWKVVVLSPTKKAWKTILQFSILMICEVIRIVISTKTVKHN